MSRRKSTGWWLLGLGVLLVIIDQVFKISVKTSFTLNESVSVLGSWFRLSFVENPGFAFGLSFGGTFGKVCLTLFRFVLFGLLVWWICSLIKKDKAPKGVLIGLTLITAGAFGNIIDCVLYGQIFSESTMTEVATFGGSYAPVMLGKVVDMFYFPLWTWPDWVPWLGGHIFFEPVFNFADSCVTVGAIYLIIFHWRFFAKD